MGWWSPTIMGGDTPLDLECEWNDHFAATRPPQTDYEAEYGPSGDVVPTEETVRAFRDNLVPDDWYTSEIINQVVAVLAMRYGIALSEEFRNELAERAMEDEEKRANWNNPADRLKHIVDLQEMLRRYDGTPMEVTEEGLFDKIAEALERGEVPGLLNDNVG